MEPQETIVSLPRWHFQQALSLTEVLECLGHAELSQLEAVGTIGASCAAPASWRTLCRSRGVDCLINDLRTLKRAFRVACTFPGEQWTLRCSEARRFAEKGCAALVSPDAHGKGARLSFSLEPREARLLSALLPEDGTLIAGSTLRFYSSALVKLQILPRFGLEDLAVAGCEAECVASLGISCCAHEGSPTLSLEVRLWWLETDSFEAAAAEDGDWTLIEESPVAAQLRGRRFQLAAFDHECWPACLTVHAGLGLSTKVCQCSEVDHLGRLLIPPRLDHVLRDLAGGKHVRCFLGQLAPP